MCVDELDWQGLNPYFIGLSILIWVLLTLISIALVVSILILLDYLFLLSGINPLINTADRMSQSLFYWIIYSYKNSDRWKGIFPFRGLNPYFIGLSILIKIRYKKGEIKTWVSILILLDYLFLSFRKRKDQL